MSAQLAHRCADPGLGGAGEGGNPDLNRATQGVFSTNNPAGGKSSWHYLALQPFNQPMLLSCWPARCGMLDIDGNAVVRARLGQTV